MDELKSLKPEAFSVELLGRVYGQLTQRHARGLDVSLGVLADVSAEEMSHLTGILQRQQGPVNEAALRDCVRIIESERQRAVVSSDDDLLALRNKLKESKGTKA